MGGKITATWDQDSYVWLYDVSGVSAMASANNAISGNSVPGYILDRTIRLRFLIQETAGSNQSETPVFRLQHNIGGAGWVTIGTATTNTVRVISSSFVTDGASTTQVLGSGTFRGGVYETSSSDTATLPATTGNDEYEVEYAIQFPSTATTPITFVDQVQFRLQVNVGAGFVDLNTYTNTANGYGLFAGQNSFRFRNDDGSETTATWMAAINTNPTTLTTASDFRLRFLLDWYDVPSITEAANFSVQYRRNGGSWTTIDTTSNYVQATLSGNFASGNATQQLGSGTFVTGKIVENTTLASFTSSATGTRETELEVMLTFNVTGGATAVSAGDVMEFRVVRTGTTTDPFIGYTNTPSVTVQGAATIAPNAIASGETVHQPTLIITQTAQPNAIASGETVHNPTLQAGSVTIAPNTIASGETVHQPTLVQGAATIVPGAIASAETVHNPTLAPGAVSIVPDAIASAETVYNPTLIAGAATIAPNAIASGETVHNPTLTTGPVTIVPDAIASGETVYNVTLSTAGAQQTIIPDHIGSAAFDTLAFDNSDATGAFWTDLPKVFEPLVTLGGGPQTVIPNAISSGETVYNVTLSPGAATIAPNAIASGETVYNVTLTVGFAAIVPDAIASGETVHNPTLSPGAVTIVPDAIASAETVYNPTLNQANTPQTVQPDTIASAETVHEPSIAGATQTIIPDHIGFAAFDTEAFDNSNGTGAFWTDPPQVHEPTVSIVSNTQTVVPDAITSGEVVYLPTIIGGVQQQDTGAGGGGSKRKEYAAIAPFIRWGRKKKKKKPAEVREVASAIMQVARQADRIPEIANQIVLPPQIDFTEVANRILEYERLENLRNMAFREFARRVEAALNEIDDEEVLLLALG